MIALPRMQFTRASSVQTLTKQGMLGDFNSGSVMTGNSQQALSETLPSLYNAVNSASRPRMQFTRASSVQTLDKQGMLGDVSSGSVMYV